LNTSGMEIHDGRISASAGDSCLHDELMSNDLTRPTPLPKDRPRAQLCGCITTLRIVSGRRLGELTGEWNPVGRVVGYMLIIFYFPLFYS